jgi:hypothetical protein
MSSSIGFLITSSLLFLILFAVIAYLMSRGKKTKQERFVDQVAAMAEQRIKTAVTDAFMAQLQRQPTAEEMTVFTSEITVKLKGMQISKNDLNSMALGLLKSKNITK